MGDNEAVPTVTKSDPRRVALEFGDYIGIAVLVGVLAGLLIRLATVSVEATPILMLLTGTAAAIGGTVVAVGTTLAVAVQSRLAQEVMNLHRDLDASRDRMRELNAVAVSSCPEVVSFFADFGRISPLLDSESDPCFRLFNTYDDELKSLLQRYGSRSPILDSYRDLLLAYRKFSLTFHRLHQLPKEQSSISESLQCLPLAVGVVAGALLLMLVVAIIPDTGIAFAVLFGGNTSLASLVVLVLWRITRTALDVVDRAAMQS
ncbi:MAG: hypothetical protein JXA58_01685 [Dehalococcoidia bacterium]|nr:hypothetical protein [Dehalococcoidia bacterium]